MIPGENRQMGEGTDWAEVNQTIPPDRTPVNSIEIRADWVALCGEWYSGQGDLLYAVSSTGGLTLGSRRPSVDVSKTGWPCVWQSLTDEEWYLSLWVGLSGDVWRAVRAAKANGGERGFHEDAEELEAFEAWVDSVVDRLRVEYGLEDSEVV
jgi:hypothetical protein